MFGDWDPHALTRTARYTSAALVLLASLAAYAGMWWVFAGIALAWVPVVWSGWLA